MDTIDYCKRGLRLLNDFQYDRAIEFLRVCYKADPQNIACLEKIAYCNYQLGRLKEARENYLTIIEHDTANTAALTNWEAFMQKKGETSNRSGSISSLSL